MLFKINVQNMRKDVLLDIFVEASQDAPTVHLLMSSDIASDLAAVGEGAANYAERMNFEGKSGELLVIPDSKGEISKVLFGLGDGNDPFCVARLSSDLPSGVYKVASPAGSESLDPFNLAVGLCLGRYAFNEFKDKKKPSQSPQFDIPKSEERSRAERIAKAVFATRDLVNTPSSHMGPEELAAAARGLADEYGASFTEVVGEDLLSERLEMIHAVGRASSREPRLIDLQWGDASAPKVTLVGKGVCFDSGGLNIKTGGSMTLMKKDMGGAANVLGLAEMIMGQGLKLRLRVLIPAVENAISSNAFRPGDVLKSRAGLTVEIENTDAEGRLVLGDALALGDEEAPDLMIDLATLTGAARTALGPELPPFYTEDETFAADVMQHCAKVADPVWRMPLWHPYAEGLISSVADISHTAPGGFAGSITAALFLQKFVSKAKSWAHFDIYAWTPHSKPGRPKGGEAQAIRTIFSLLCDRYG